MLMFLVDIFSLPAFLFGSHPGPGVMLIIGLSCKFEFLTWLNCYLHSNCQRGGRRAGGKEGGRRARAVMLSPSGEWAKPQLAFREHGKKVISPTRQCKWYFERVWMGASSLAEETWTDAYFFHYQIYKHDKWSDFLFQMDISHAMYVWEELYVPHICFLRVFSLL